MNEHTANTLTSAGRVTSRRVAAATLGCKLNQYETEAVLGQFLRRGWRGVPVEEEADLVLVDTCTVTDRADQKARQLIRQVIRRNPEAVVVVMGCYSQAAARELAAIPGVDWIVGTGEKARLAELIGEPAKQDEPVVSVARPGRGDPMSPPQVFERQTRAWLKVQDGCDVFCSFCIIPFTRGRSRSVSPGEVLAQARGLLAAGHRELVLTGVHLGGYGRDLSPVRGLPWLCRRLLELPGLLRLRLSSIEPWDISVELLEAMAADPRFCPHLHTALQSGSDEILAAMGRRGGRRELEELFARIARLLPGAGLGSDLIAGFPGEEERHFAETLELVERLPLSRLHVFPYSPRRGTRAARLPAQVPAALKRERCRRLLELGERLQAQAHRRALGQVVEVLAERRVQDGALHGYTPDYLRVELPLAAGEDAGAVANRLWRVRLREERGDRLLGERLEAVA